MFKSTLFTLLLLLVAAFDYSATAQSSPSKGADTTLVQVVEASCGQCQFGLKGKGCDLAVRINGTAYFVDGTAIDDHGDAHDNDGFCNAVRKAEVKGKVVNGRFKAYYFKLLPPQQKQ